ncbi:NAD-dependent epimerase/dehydratase family protein [Steroidobacter agaridevorans]|uniref:NAD-dependent epimerase/dehydratase family protein n=1 Tax=Steroidobacter agaridevorans TaxID=2695856 RepID=UPI0013255716|nr:NAD-dependent epimerase/dehydratase family protein [Steroidobacter agaridevorans]GFE86429.1 nucleotide sugar dehydratase [Steroidobacter agaridevorans]
MATNRIQITQRQDVSTILGSDLPWNKLDGCRVVVTGAAGFLGGYLVRTLLALYPSGKVDRPLNVIAVVRDVPQARARLGDVTDDPNLAFQTSDLNAIARLEVADCNYVLHAASQASPRFYSVDPVGTLLPNALGTAALLACLRSSADPRGMLFVSSSEVYGDVPSSRSLHEEAYGVLNPTSIRACYAEGKRFGEALCAAWYHQYQLPTYIVRPFHTYGPGLQENDGRVFADFAFNVVRGENIVMNSDGAARRAFCYVSDAIAGFFTVLLTGEPAVPYNVANPAGELSVYELAQLLVNLYPQKMLSVVRRAPSQSGARSHGISTELLPDTSRLTALGWRAKIDPEQGFRRMIDAY